MTCPGKTTRRSALVPFYCLAPLFLLILVLVSTLGACSQADKAEAVDVLSQRVTPQGKIPITVLVKHTFSIDAFEQAVEAKFPGLDLVQVGNFTRDRGVVEYERRMEHDDLPDMVMTWPLHVGEKYWEDRLLDLSGMPFTGRYNTTILNTIAKGGKLYYLPGPAQVRGIVYNKTLFAEKGWSVPHDFKGFVDLCKKIEASGMRSLQLGFRNAEVLDSAFVGYSYGGCFSSPADAQWLSDYNQGKGSIGAHLGPAFATFKTMIDAGIWKKGDLAISYAARERMLFTRRCAMTEGSVLMARMGYERTRTTDEFALMPFFNPGEPSDWARIYMVCYIGLNKHLVEEKNKEKYDLILQLMDFISTAEGQRALTADTGALYSSLKGVPLAYLPEIANLERALSSGRYAIFPELKNAQEVLRKGLAGLLAGELTQSQVNTMVDVRNQQTSSPVVQVILGTADDNFTLIETGNFLTDAMRDHTGADMALFLDNGKDGQSSGKGLSARLYKGPQTMDDVMRVLPDLRHGDAGVLQVVTMTGENLLRTLEHSIVVDNDKRGWFYYFSGLRMDYAPAAAPGSRIRKVSDVDGKPIDPQRVYSVAVMDGTIPKDFALSTTDAGIFIKNLLTKTIRAQGRISPSKDGRFVLWQP